MKIALRISYLIFIAIALTHWSRIFQYTVNIPFVDDWEFVGGERIPESLNLSWLTMFHNEHRILLTRLQSWLSFHLNDWNVRSLVIFNFGLFLFLLASLFALCNRLKLGVGRLLCVLVLVFCLSTTAHENHMWMMQSTFHYLLIFAFLGIILLQQRTTTFTVLAMFCFLLSTFSLASGIAIVTSACLVALIDRVYAYLSRDLTVKAFILQFSLIAVGLALLLYSFLNSFQFIPGHHKPIGPTSWPFWHFLMNLTSLGFGFQTVNKSIGVLCLIVSLIPMFLILRRPSELFKNRNATLIFTLYAGTFAALAAISFGRASFPIEASKSSRYGEVAMLIPVFSVMLWQFSDLPHRFRGTAHFGSIAIILLCTWGNWNSWNFEQTYRVENEKRTTGLNCISKYYLDKNQPTFCPTIYPGDLKFHLDIAETMNVSFYQDIKKNRN